jgi:hypothetical protein
MDPPLDEPPDGEWHCPQCPPVIPGHVQMLDVQYLQGNGQLNSNDPIDLTREASPSPVVETLSASTRRGKRKVGRKGKGRASRAVPAADPSEAGEDVEIEVDDTPVITPRVSIKPRKSGTRQRAPSSEEEEPVNTPVRAPRRRRSTQIPATPPPATSLRVRLRIPVRGKGKEREEDEASHGLFDDILSPEERDTSKTTITNTDKLYFERSRVTAEVNQFFN